MKLHPARRAKWFRWFMAGMSIAEIEVRESPLPPGAVEDAIRTEGNQRMSRPDAMPELPALARLGRRAA